MPHGGQSLIELTQLPEGAGDQVQANLVVDGDPPVATLPAAVCRARCSTVAPMSRRPGGSGGSGTGGAVHGARRGG